MGKENYRLTSKGRGIAWVAKAESEGKEFSLGVAFKYATEGKGILQYIFACICIAVCFPIGIAKALLRG